MSDWRAEIPARIKKLPVNKDGYPVPWFVAFIEGVPDFRVIGPDKIRDAVKMKLCWVCGEPLGAWLAFTIGPMCAINRVSSEPPAHRECAIFSAKACPFLSNPERPRRESNLPVGHQEPAGLSIDRNPGVTLIWITKSYKIIYLDRGILFDIGPHEETLWYARGRLATREEVIVSIETGMPALEKAAQEDGEQALALLEKRCELAIGLLPS